MSNVILPQLLCGRFLKTEFTIEGVSSSSSLNAETSDNTASRVSCVLNPSNYRICFQGRLKWKEETVLFASIDCVIRIWWHVILFNFILGSSPLPDDTFSSLVNFQAIGPFVVDTDDGSAVFEIDMGITLEGNPRVGRNGPSIVHFEIRVPSFQAMYNSRISSPVSGIVVVIEDGILAVLLGERLWLVFHARGIFID